MEEEINIVSEEHDRRIVEKLNNILDAGEAAMVIIAPYSGLVVAPHVILYPYIDFPEEFNIKQAIDAIKRKLCERNLLKEGKIERLFLLIQSPGGGVISSFKVAKLIRENVKEVVSFIIHFAMSGGILIVLASNKIVMGPISHVSPIDIQMKYKEDFISSNDIIRAFRGVSALFEKIPEENAPYSWKVLAEKLDPIMIQEAMNVNELAKTYALKLLTHEYSSLKNRAEEIVRRLVEGYPTHDYVIDYKELKEIFGEDNVIYAEELEENNKIRKLWYVFEEWFSKYKDLSSNRHIVRYYTKVEYTAQNNKRGELNVQTL